MKKFPSGKGNIMKKTILIFACFIVLMLVGCENELTPIPELTEPTPTATIDALKPIFTILPNEENIPDYILGNWIISYAENGDTGENYPLYKLYGTGLEYGGNLTLNDDATFKRYIGITTDEAYRYEGTYSVEDDEITFNFIDGAISTAKYLPSSKELEYHTKDTNQVPINEYYIKK